MANHMAPLKLDLTDPALNIDARSRLEALAKIGEAIHEFTLGNESLTNTEEKIEEVYTNTSSKFLAAYVDQNLAPQEVSTSSDKFKLRLSLTNTDSADVTFDAAGDLTRINSRHNIKVPTVDEIQWLLDHYADAHEMESNNYTALAPPVDAAGIRANAYAYLAYYLLKKCR